tara:strand:- start:73 stop:795 length:723 start_codon:yes stop_codon:yes gene_type:complete
MCFDARTSAISFSIGALSSSYLYYKGKKENNKSDLMFSLMVFLISLMQLIEYFLWKNQSCNKINHMFSLLVIVLLTAQPILASNYYYHLYKNNTIVSGNLVLLYSIIFTLFSIYLLYLINQSNLCSTTTKNSCRLHWASMKELTKYKSYYIIWTILYTIPYLIAGYDFTTWGYKIFKKYPIRYLFPLISYIITILYILNKPDDIFELLKNPMMFTKYVDAWGSLWCFSSVLLGIVGILEI